MSDARVFQESVEAAVSGQTTAARVSQEQVEAAVTGQASTARASQVIVEVAVPWQPDTITPEAIGSGEQVGIPAVQPPPTDLIQPTGIASRQSVGTPALEGFIEVIRISSDEEFGTPFLPDTWRHVFPQRIASSEAVGNPTIAATSSSFILTLDTTAPTVTWGAQTGTTAGELLQLAYTADEPIAAADLTLADGRVLALTVGATALSVLLPADAADGRARVRVRDDVGNERAYPGLVQIHGTVIIPEPTEPPRVPAWPVPRRGTDPARATSLRVSRSRNRARTQHAVRVDLEVKSRATAKVQTQVSSRMSIVATMSPRTATRTRARVASATAAAMGTDHAVARRDGEELELLLLDP